tara:strand:+ start:17368 stop:18282 length:915 start_codon:yes stop_codon:yes gene_type:complete
MSRRYDLKPAYSFDEAKETAGQMVSESDFDILINTDCDAYDELGNPLFFFRKGAIDKRLCAAAYPALRSAATPTSNRGMAGGIINEETKSEFQGVHEKTRLRIIKKDGTLSNTTRANSVNSGIVGYFDRTARFPYCRQTAWYEKNFNQFKTAYPYIKRISDLFSEACPEKYSAQRAISDQTHPDFMIKDTVFTTITVNKNFRTALHTDAGDYQGGLGNLAVLQAGKYTGGYTVIPRYRCAFDVRTGDVCFFNVHEYHANTEIHAQLAYERISIVCYYREHMHACLSAEAELKRVQNRKLGDKLQ